MLPLPTRCPLTGGEIIVTRIYCPDADVSIDGRFAVAEPPFARLTPEQIQFVEIFVRNEGKLNRMEEDLGLSYPTIRSRLHDVIRALGYEPGKEEAAPAVDRKQVLAELEAGSLSFDEAMQKLAGGD
ncbi:MAG: DUF2089 domain-containing protein [Caldilinea sp.]|nr:DUF2089 domain-containing protein [Caldilinea sp.]MCB0151804.1 DUF2089 domain-containing protein [Caldilineaceae bacterium]MCB0053608.1 DUF2089 domain-containing protein [Caldilinea sp.]MCB9115764.1 DUF2089 domain-containing protein [Caldilineaceae bacterium]MCB9120589.1 DUF2089 domain-containing protein [Caldilineaceae bacterium]